MKAAFRDIVSRHLRPKREVVKAKEMSKLISLDAGLKPKKIQGEGRKMIIWSSQKVTEILEEYAKLNETLQTNRKPLCEDRKHVGKKKAILGSDKTGCKGAGDFGFLQIRKVVELVWFYHVMSLQPKALKNFDLKFYKMLKVSLQLLS